MRKTLSLQWKLTLTTAVLVIAACLCLSYAISKSAIFYMGDIEDTVTMIFLDEPLSENPVGNVKIHLDTTKILSDMVRNTQTEFWRKSVLTTAVVTLLSSFLIYWIVGHTLSPLQKLSAQIQEIQAKNLQQTLPQESDSTEILQLTESFNEMLHRLNDAFLMQKQFSANAAHELRTPLAVIQTELEVYEKNNKSGDADSQAMIARMKFQTNRLAHVIDILLEMTELQSAAKNDHISLAALTEEVICDLSAVADKKAITLTQNPGDVEVMGNDTLLYRAIYNLIENAIKYNRPQGQVSVEIKPKDAFAQIRITDTGMGIAREDWDQIFEPFFRVDKSRSRAMGGAGLGLALVREIARQHSGDAAILQSSPQGTQIELRLLRR